MLIIPVYHELEGIFSNYAIIAQDELIFNTKIIFSDTKICNRFLACFTCGVKLLEYRYAQV